MGPFMALWALIRLSFPFPAPATSSVCTTEIPETRRDVLTVSHKQFHAELDPNPALPGGTLNNHLFP